MNVPLGHVATPLSEDSDVTQGNVLRLFRAFALDPAGHLPALRVLLTEAPETVLGPAADFLLTAPTSLATHLLARLLLIHGALIPLITDPGASASGQALALARIVQANTHSLNLRLAQVLVRLDPGTAEGRCRVRRILFLLDGLPPNPRIVPALMRLLRSDDSIIRSKAVKLIGAGRRDLHAVAIYTRDSDARVRANAIESIWGADTPEFRAFLRFASQDPHPRAAANAMIGLYILRDKDAPRLLESMAHSADARCQASAAWAMGRCGDSVFLPSLRKLVDSPHPVVRRSALRSLVAINAQVTHPA